MIKPWSISTTLRNPDRARNFLITLSKLEGVVWDENTQSKFQVMLLQDRFYGLTPQFFQGMRTEDVDLIQGSDDISYEKALKILEAKKYVGGLDMRGRNSFAPLKKLGLAAIKSNKLTVTSLGKYFLTEDYDLGELFFRSFIKWQLPNPDDSSFRTQDGFNVKPFVATLHLISKVNKLWSDLGHETVGISKLEFEIFVHTLCDYKNIELQAKKLIDFREQYRSKKQQEQKKFSDNYKINFVKEFLNTTDEDRIKKCIENLHTYTDNTLRYFRLTRLIIIRGRGYYVDLEKLRAVEIDSLLKIDNAKAETFESIESYQDYISDITQPVLPWETQSALKEIVKTIIEDISKKLSELAATGTVIKTLEKENYELMSINELKTYIEKLRDYRRSLFEQQIHDELQNTSAIEECIEAFSNLRNAELKPSVELERVTTMALNALNDSLSIKPNYPVGDDNVPTFTAPANRPDIECFYNSFNSICEVTLLNGRDQWYNEGQPVMRHLRDFETKNSSKEAYAIFIAPSLHIDTLETFRFAIVSGYRGTRQKIIPMTIEQFVSILQTLLEIKKQNKSFEHKYIKSLFDGILLTMEKEEDPTNWLVDITKTILGWNTKLLSGLN